MPLNLTDPEQALLGGRSGPAAQVGPPLPVALGAVFAF